MISGTASALRSWLLTRVPMPICLCKPFSCKACPGTYRLEARVARFDAARPASSGFRSSNRPSASITRSPQIGVTFPGKGGLFWPPFCQPSVAPLCSHGNSVAHRPQPSNSEVRVSYVRASSLDRSLVSQVCVARTRLRVDLRDSSGRKARERFLRR